jgi:hypothetical protein
MKKTFKFLGLTLAVLFVFNFIACKDDPPKGEEPVGYAKFGDNDIPIYAGVGVTDEEAAGKKGVIDAAYEGLTDNVKAALVNTQKIVIVTGNDVSADKPTGTINLGKDQTNVSGALTLAATVFISVIDNSKETVRMAFAAVNSKGNVKSI